MKRRAFELCVVTWVLLVSARASAKELDQFTDRLRVLAYYAGGYRSIPGAPSPAQVDGILDGRMNWLLDKLAATLQREKPRTVAERDDSVRGVFQHGYLAELITPYEEWVKHEAPVPLYKVRDKGIYGHTVDYSDMRLTWYIELSPIIQVSGVTMGLDKLGHYLAQGFQYYEHWKQLDPQLSAAARAQAVRVYGHEQEVGQLGIATGGVYSPADLAANWAGMLFFMALFDDLHFENARHARYIDRDSHGRYQRVRDFHWSEWVSADWDEVQNPTLIERRVLFDKVQANFLRPQAAPGRQAPSICDEYRANPSAFVGAFTAPSRSRYALPERGRAAAPYALDIRHLCAEPRVSLPQRTAR